MEYLEFELPIKELEDQLQKCQIIGEESDVDVSETSLQILQKLDVAKKEIYKNLTPWQRVQLSRHPNRPYTLDYINSICGDSFLIKPWLVVLVRLAIKALCLLANKKDIIPKHVSIETLEWRIQKGIERLSV